MDRCKGSDPLFEKKYRGSLSNKLFSDYAENLKKMIQSTNKNQQALLTIINQIFVYTIDPQTGKKQIRVNPSLTEKRLQEIVVETRALIIKLYLTCEMDYVNGLKMYEAIVEQKILETAQNQIKNLENISEQLVVEDKIPEPAELQQIKKKAEEKIAEDKEKVEKQVESIKSAEEVVDKDPSAVLTKNVETGNIKGVDNNEVKVEEKASEVVAEKV
jgi:hypothetical protein